MKSLSILLQVHFVDRADMFLCSLLSRAHSNYLAQINIRMNERAEKTNDVLSNLTVLGTIVLPMNIITGMWGVSFGIRPYV
jgi:Mg2+ and Co2+ transporter CorA